MAADRSVGKKVGEGEDRARGSPQEKEEEEKGGEWREGEDLFVSN